MVFQTRCTQGTNPVAKPECGKKYYVVVSKPDFEIWFEATITSCAFHDYLKEPEDRTSIFVFDNGTTIHGEGITFFEEAPAVDEEGRKFYSGLMEALSRTKE